MKPSLVFVFFLVANFSYAAKDSLIYKTWNEYEKEWWNCHANFWEHCDFAQAIAFCDQLDSIARSANDLRLICRAQTFYSRAYMGFGRKHIAFSRALSFDRKFTELQKQEYCSEYSYFLGVLVAGFHEIGDYQSALNTLRRMHALECSRSPIQNYDIALELYHLGEEDSSVIQMENYINELNNDEVDENLLISGYNQLGLILRLTGRYNEAIQAFKTAIDFAESSGKKKNLIPVIYGNMGSCYSFNGEPELAYPFLEIDSEGSLQNKEIGSHILSEMNLAKIDEELKNWDRAASRYEALFRFGELRGELKAEVHLYLSNIYKRKGNLKKAYSNLQEYFSIQSELQLIAATSKEKIEKELIISAYHSELKQTELEKELFANKLVLEKKDNEFQQRKLYFYLIISILVIGFLVLFFMRLKSNSERKITRARYEREVYKKNLELEEQKNQVLELQKSETDLLISQICFELKLKESFSDQLVKYLEKNKIDLDRKDLLALKMFVSNELEQKSVMVPGSVNVNTAFFVRIKKEFPGLTESELSLISLVLRNFGNKEMAISRSMTVGSIKVAKNRLKKKLGLDGSEDLKTFLETFMET